MFKFKEIEENEFMKPHERWWKEAGIDTPFLHWTGIFGRHFIMTLNGDCVKQILTSKPKDVCDETDWYRLGLASSTTRFLEDLMYL